MSEQNNTDGAAVAREVSPPITSGGQKLEEAERLRIENIYLQLVNCQLRVQNLDRQKEDVIKEMRALQASMEAARAELSAKYGTDISRTTVTPDGTIKTGNGAPKA